MNPIDAHDMLKAGNDTLAMASRHACTEAEAYNALAQKDRHYGYPLHSSRQVEVRRQAQVGVGTDSRTKI